MQCPYCGKQQSSVLESRLAEEGQAIRRRRVCEHCEKRFTTYERVEGVDLVVVKKNGQNESFDREKIRKGIIKATWKRPIAMADIDQIIDEVERQLRHRRGTQVKSWEIGNLVMSGLRSLDPVAFLLFASVYKDFQSFEDFEEEITSLRKLISSRQLDSADGIDGELGSEPDVSKELIKSSSEALFKSSTSLSAKSSTNSSAKANSSANSSAKSSVNSTKNKNKKTKRGKKATAK